MPLLRSVSETQLGLKCDSLVLLRLYFFFPDPMPAYL